MVEFIYKLIYKKKKRLFIYKGGVDNRGSGIWSWVKGITQLVLVVVYIE